MKIKENINDEYEEEYAKLHPLLSLTLNITEKDLKNIKNSHYYKIDNSINSNTNNVNTPSSINSSSLSLTPREILTRERDVILDALTTSSIHFRYFFFLNL